MRINAGDKLLEDCLKNSPKNATYTSNTTQNDLLLCMKQFIQSFILEEVKSQTIGPYYGSQRDEVIAGSNWKQLGLILHYIKEKKPVERLLVHSL